MAAVLIALIHSGVRNYFSCYSEIVSGADGSVPGSVSDR